MFRSQRSAEYDKMRVDVVVHTDFVDVNEKQPYLIVVTLIIGIQPFTYFTQSRIYIFNIHILVFYDVQLSSSYCRRLHGQKKNNNNTVICYCYLVSMVLPALPKTSRESSFCFNSPFSLSLVSVSVVNDFFSISTRGDPFTIHPTYRTVCGF